MNVCEFACRDVDWRLCVVVALGAGIHISLEIHDGVYYVCICYMYIWETETCLLCGRG